MLAPSLSLDLAIYVFVTFGMRPYRPIHTRVTAGVIYHAVSGAHVTDAFPSV